MLPLVIATRRLHSRISTMWYVAPENIWPIPTLVQSLLQCEFCCCWQHAECFGIKRGEPPEKYVCFMCVDTPGARESCRYLYRHNWRKRGESLRPYAPSSSSRSQRAVGILVMLNWALCALWTVFYCCSKMVRYGSFTNKTDERTINQSMLCIQFRSIWPMLMD